MMKLENKTNIKEVTQINDIKIVLSNIQELDQEIIKNIKSTDEHLTTELILYIENDFELYQKLKIYKELLIKKINNGIKKYMKDFTTLTKISYFINNNDRLYIYNYFVEKMLIDEL